ncbi:tRNA (adenosine(37)-N6)-dimethylallyltransferase [Patescibacteria group bacterium]
MPIKLIVISGPTASGKTRLALALAKKYDGYIINADSRTIYKGLDLATAKPTKTEQKQVKHYLIDIIRPDQRYTVVDFKRQAEKIINTKKGLPFIVGGTGLYISALTENWQFDKQTIGPAKYESLVLVLNPSRSKLYQQINKRVINIWQKGLVAETKKLQKKYKFSLPPFTGIGYREVAAYLDGQLTKDQAIAKIQINTRRYAKRQWTWWRARKNVNWIKTRKEAEQLIRDFNKR